MTTFRIAASAAASVLFFGIGQASAADPGALNAAHAAAGQRAAAHWTPSALSAAKLRPLPVVDPAAVSAATGPQERTERPVRVTNGSMGGGAIGGSGGGAAGGGDGGTGIGGSGGGSGDGGGGSGGGAGGGDGSGGPGGGTDGGTGVIGGGGVVGGGGGGGGGGGDIGGGGGSGGGGGGGDIGGGGGSGGGGGGVANLPLWGGKLYFSTPDGDYVCAAQFVSKNVILTAAQCLQDDRSGQYFQNLQFVQTIPGGKERVFDTECAATFQGWTQPGDEKWTYDMGMVLLKGTSPNGWMGLTWNWKSLSGLGYVGEDGRVTAASGSVSLQKGIVQITRSSGGKDPLGGAAWMTATQDDNGQLQHSFTLESFTFKDQPGVTYGPYFDDRIKTLFDYTQNGCQ